VEDAQSEGLEWKLQEREEEWRVEAADLGAGGELPLFLCTPNFMAFAEV